MTVSSHPNHERTQPECIKDARTHARTHVSNPFVLPRYASLAPSREKAGERASRSVGVRHWCGGRGLGAAEGATAYRWN